MTERDIRRQAGNNPHRQDGFDDGAWAVNAALLNASAFDVDAGTPVPPQPTPLPAQYSQIVFIEGDVPDARQLAGGVTSGTLAVILNPNGDGVAQIAAFLSSHAVSGLTAIDIVAHGADGTVQLGTGALNAASLSQYQAALATIGGALRPGGDIQIYGCDVAQDAAGVSFLDQLSAATGANVAAASHLVGAASGGGSWNLDVNTGAIDASSPFTAAAEEAFPAELQAAGSSELILAFNVSAGNSASIETMAVNGSQTATGVTSLSSSSNLSEVAGQLSTVIEAPQGRYYVVDDDVANGHGSTDRILVGTFGSSSLSSPAILDFTNSASISPWGIAEGPNANILYMANFDAANTNLNGIWQINVNTGAASAVAVSSAAQGPDLLAIDYTNNLGFFTDDFNNVSQIEVGNLSTGNVQILFNGASNEVLYGIAVNAVTANSGTLYFDAGYDLNVNGVFEAKYTLSGGQVTLGTVNTLYTIATNGSVSPMGLAIDPTTGVFYIGDDASTGRPTWNVWEGSLGGSAVQANLIQVYSSANEASFNPSTDALSIETAPTVVANGSVSVAQGNSVALDAGATVTNPDNQGIASATVVITNAVTGDTLSANTAGTSITASFSSGTLTLSGADTAAHYQQVLDSVSFSTTGAAGTRNINWTASDGVINSTTPTSSVNVAARETLVAGATASFTGGGSPVTLDSALSVSDPSSANLVSATVVIGGFITGDTLTVGNLGGLSQAFSNGTLTLSGSKSVATYQAALDSVTYSFNPANGDPTGGGSHTSRTISWSVNDGVITSVPVTSTLNEIHVAPTITTSGTVTYTGPSAVPLDTTVVVSDPDSAGNLSGATIKIGTGFSSGDSLVFTNQNGIIGSYNAGNGTETLTGSANFATYEAAMDSIAFTTTNASHAQRTINWTATDGVASSNTSSSEVNVICFRADTMIATPSGEVPVQTLKAGDIVLTAHNGPRPVTWVGTGKVLATRGKRSAATPVIVRKGALADNLPHRDLHVTKAHSLYIDNVLIPVEFLVNHKTILWDDRAQEVEIYHIELESHDLLIANGTPAESYRDDGNRWLFQNANEGWHLPPQEPYAPVLTGGPIVDAAWERFLNRAGPRNTTPLTDDPDFHLIIDGQRIDARERRDGAYIFGLPFAPTSVFAASRAAAPSELGTARDPRSLGVAIRRVTIQQGAKFMLFDADDERLTQGFHDYEPADNLRWTKGYAELPIQAFARFDQGAEIKVHLATTTRYPADRDDARQAAA